MSLGLSGQFADARIAPAIAAHTPEPRLCVWGSREREGDRLALRRIDRVSSAGFDPLRLKRITDCIRLAALEKKIFHTQITQIGGCAAITSNL